MVRAASGIGMEQEMEKGIECPPPVIAQAGAVLYSSPGAVEVLHHRRSAAPTVILMHEVKAIVAADP
jgi:hypothetical protein